MLFKIKLLLFCILLLAAVLRIWNLGLMPPHLRNDEASLGYNAYSILTSGKDEYGESLPILFKSFEDFKPGLYVYLTVPFIKILGLNEWAVRLPAAASGILGVYLLYYFVWLLFKNQKVALSAAFLLAISPWHITFSRGVWEAQLTFTLTLAGLIFLLKALEKRPLYLILAAVVLGSTLLMSHSAKPSTPLALLVFVIAFWKSLKKIPKKIILLGLLIFIILSLPVTGAFFNEKNTRVKALLVPDIQVFDFSLNFLKHFSLSTLFLKGDGNPQHSAADFGAFLTADLVLLYLGLKNFKNDQTIKKEVKAFMLLWLILAPLSSAATKEGVNFVRYLNFFVPLTIIVSLGLARFKKSRAWGVFFVFLILNFLLFLDAYFIHARAKNGAWQYGYKTVVEVTAPIQKNYSKVYIPAGPDQPYIFFLFYQAGMGYIPNLSNIEFVDFNQFQPLSNKPHLIVIPQGNFSFERSYKFFYEVKDPVGLTIYKIGEYML